MSRNRNTRGQRGLARATIALANSCLEIIKTVQPITVRGVCYRLFVAGLIDSMAVKNTQKISRLLVRLREDGYLPWEWIVDDSRRTERKPHWTDIKEYAGVIEQSYRRDFWEHQRYRVVVISEKSTVAGILRPVLHEYGIPFMSLHGYNSATKVYELAQEIQTDRRVHVFLYVGDFDCSGMHMSEIDLPSRLKQYGADGFHLIRVALDDTHIRNLPSFQAKQTDPRYRWYVGKYGVNAWELDAMDPNTLRDGVRKPIEVFVEKQAWERHKRTEDAEKETVKRVAEKLIEAVA